MRLMPIAVCVTAGLLLSACAGPIVVGAVSLDRLLSIASLGSTVVTGKGLGEHAMDVATGSDCRLLEGAVRDDRALCEKIGSPATKKDFRGLDFTLSSSPGIRFAADTAKLPPPAIRRARVAPIMPRATATPRPDTGITLLDVSLVLPGESSGNRTGPAGPAPRM